VVKLNLIVSLSACLPYCFKHETVQTVFVCIKINKPSGKLMMLEM